MAQVGFSIYSKFSLEDFHRDINRALNAAKFQRWLEEAAEKAYETAYKLCPVDTGWMQGQLKVEVSQGMVSLECLADYASYHEFGWVARMFGGTDTNPVQYKGGYRPFIRPGVIRAEKYLDKKIEMWVHKYLLYGK